MLMETESRSESKQTSGYGVDLQRSFMEDKWESKVEGDDEDEEVMTKHVEKKIENRSRDGFKLREAMDISALDNFKSQTLSMYLN